MSPVSKLLFLCLCSLCIWAGAGAQSSPTTSSSLDSSSIQLKNAKGKMVSYATVKGSLPVMMVCFWSVNSDVSISELNAINTQYAKKSTPFTLLAICIDEGNLVNRMRPTALQNDWTFDVYADIDGGLQKLLHFTQLPQVFILNKGEVVYQQSGFQPGTENYLMDKIRALAAKK